MLFLSVLIVVLLFSGVIVYLSACKTFARVGVSVVSRSALSTIGLSLQAMLLITMWALHPRELSIIVACIKYVKDLCCEGGVVVAHPLHCKGITSLLNFKICGLILLRFGGKSLIFSVKNFRLGTAFAPLSCLSWRGQPPVTSPKSFTTRAYYI